jgi:high-affinity iron transporter
LIGLREGLEAGLVVSILLAAVRRTGKGVSAAPLWLGLAAAAVLALSFGAVLTFSQSAMSTAVREAFGGILSLIAVGLVTAMIFWMRRTARSLAGELTARVGDALRVGGAAVALIAFLAVGREGLETALFLWTTVQASGETAVPLLGALVGLGIAVGLCWLLYRRAIRFNLGTFFTRTGILLVVIAAGVLAYGLGDLQGAGILPGRSWLAFDLSAYLSVDTWWVAIVAGATNLRPSMTWLQVVAYLGYVAVVVSLFRRGATAPAATAAESAKAASTGEPVPRPAGSRWPMAKVLGTAMAGLAIPAIVAASVIAVRPGGAGSTDIRITRSACAPGWTAAKVGSKSMTFNVVNDSGHSGEIYLLDAVSGAVAGELEGLGPGTRQSMPVNLADGDYTWRCVMAGQEAHTSAVVHVTGTGRQAAANAVLPVSEKDLAGPADAYRDYVAPKLGDLAAQVTNLRAKVAVGDLTAARAEWLAAQLTWEEVGAAYGSFGDLGSAIDGLPAGLPAGVQDPDFTGLHRVEYGLWHGQGSAELLPVVDRLARDVAELRAKLPEITVDPTELPLRAHEILEDALRDHLAGVTDLGSGAGFAETYADLKGTRVVLDELAPLVTARRPNLLPTAVEQMDTLERVLVSLQHDGAWTAGPTTAPLDVRQKVAAALGELLETLAPVPDLLEVRGP